MSAEPVGALEVSDILMRLFESTADHRCSGEKEKEAVE